MSRVGFVVNRTRVRHLEAFHRTCREAAATRGWEPPLLLETTVEDPGPGLARQAIAAGAQLVFAVGGDGTVRACAEALADTGVPLAIVPRGTANLVARSLRIPTDLVAALDVGLSGDERRIDLAVADGMTYAAMAGVGLDAEVVGAAAGWLKDRAGWLAYAASGLRHLPGRRTAFTVRLDSGEPLCRRARSVVVGNVGLLPGGFTLLPAARLDDGMLDVGILAPANPLGWAQVGYRVLVRSPHDDARLERHRARRVEIQAEADLPREVDGEVIPPARSLTVTIRPGALVVRVPAGRTC